MQPLPRPGRRAVLIEDTRAQLVQRYGRRPREGPAQHLSTSRSSTSIVLPDPDLDREHLADFAASIVLGATPAMMLGYLRRWQEDCGGATSAVLIKRGLSLALAEDWIGLTERDRRFLPTRQRHGRCRPAARVWTTSVHGGPGLTSNPSASGRTSSSAVLVSCRDDERYEAYLWQLRRATRLEPGGHRHARPGVPVHLPRVHRESRRRTILSGLKFRELDREGDEARAEETLPHHQGGPASGRCDDRHVRVGARRPPPRDRGGPSSTASRRRPCASSPHRRASRRRSARRTTGPSCCSPSTPESLPTATTSGDSSS